MARYSVGARAAGAGSSTLPIGSIYSVAGGYPRLREVGVFATTAVGAFTIALCRLSTTGTQGSALTEAQLDGTGTSAVQGFNTHTVAPTIVDLGYRFHFPAAIGAGVIWTFNNEVGATAPVATTNGIGLYVPNGTGAICDFYFVWDE